MKNTSFSSKRVKFISLKFDSLRSEIYFSEIWDFLWDFYFSEIVQDLLKINYKKFEIKEKVKPGLVLTSIHTRIWWSIGREVKLTRCCPIGQVGLKWVKKGRQHCWAEGYSGSGWSKQVRWKAVNIGILIPSRLNDLEFGVGWSVSDNILTPKVA